MQVRFKSSIYVQGPSKKGVQGKLMAETQNHRAVIGIVDKSAEGNDYAAWALSEDDALDFLKENHIQVDPKGSREEIDAEIQDGIKKTFGTGKDAASKLLEAIVMHIFRTQERMAALQEFNLKA